MSGARTPADALAAAVRDADVEYQTQAMMEALDAYDAARLACEDDEPVAYVVLRGEDESTSIVLYASDVDRLRRCLENVPIFSPSDDAEQQALNERLLRLVGKVASR